MLMREGKIYTLEHPITKEIRYIGKTTRSLKKRLSEHVSEASFNHGVHKINWINSLGNQLT